MIKVLSVTSECVPLIKTGGLADVAGALPGVLIGQGITMRTLMPGYPGVLAQLEAGQEIREFPDLFGGSGRLIEARHEGLDLLILDAPHLYDREGGPYGDQSGADWPDNPERFAALCFVAASLALDGPWVPDLIHGHDWQAGFVREYQIALGSTDVPFVFSVHNIAFNGPADPAKLGVLGLDAERFTPDHFEFWGRISALKAGLTGADKITTVSRTYANELLTKDFGMGMDGVLRSRQADLCGIVNGIDTDIWNPATDPLIKSYKTARGKAANKQALQAHFGLGEADGPLCVLVSRLTEQKGIDLLLESLPDLLKAGGQLALLGSGDPGLEYALRSAAAAHEQVAVQIGYNEPLSHLMIAGGDAILVPSRFEPCGLTQLYGLRYGTVPVVSLTGGLADTVINASPAALAQGVATGLQFFPITSAGLSDSFRHLCALYSSAKIWGQIQRNAMKQPVGWDASAAEYAALYAQVLGR